MSIRVVHNTAYDFGWHTLTLASHHGGDPITSRRRYFELWRKGNDAKWRIELFIDNLDVPPAMPDDETDSPTVYLQCSRQ